MLSLALLASVAGPVGWARAATYAVTTTADVGGDCVATPDQCSLRQAVTAANSTGEADQINLPAGRFVLDAGPGLEVSGGQLGIAGVGADETQISGGGSVRVLSVTGGASAMLSDLDVIGGAAKNGGGVAVDEGSELTVVNSAITGNFALGPGSAGSLGGGAYNAGHLTVVGSTISGNSAETGNVGGGNGGGIANSGVLEVTNSTISGNKATSGPGSGARGGGINSFGGSVSLTSVTLASNVANAPGHGGNIYVGGGRITYFNTIVANGVAQFDANCSGPLVSTTRRGRNLESANTCRFGGRDYRNKPARLGPLAANGGPTLTHALLSGSPAIDGGLTCPSSLVDQRGVSRPQGAACDIGAVEGPPLVGALGGAGPPVIGTLRMSPSKIVAYSGRGSSVVARATRGGRVSYGLSEAATVSFRVDRRRGRRWVHVRGRFSHAGRAGVNRFRFTGRLRLHRLRAGRYRLVARATDATGQRGSAKTRRFRVVR